MFSYNLLNSATSKELTLTTLSTIIEYNIYDNSKQFEVAPDTSFGVFFNPNFLFPGSCRSGDYDT